MSSTPPADRSFSTFLNFSRFSTVKPSHLQSRYTYSSEAEEGFPKEPADKNILKESSINVFKCNTFFVKYPCLLCAMALPSLYERTAPLSLLPIFLGCIALKFKKPSWAPNKGKVENIGGGISIGSVNGSRNCVSVC